MVDNLLLIWQSVTNNIPEITQKSPSYHPVITLFALVKSL